MNLLSKNLSVRSPQPMTETSLARVQGIVLIFGLDAYHKLGPGEGEATH